MDFTITDSVTLAEKWRRWRQTMELYLNLSIPDKSDKEKCSIFLYLIGQTGRDIHSTMTLTNEEKDKIGILFRKYSKCQRKDESVSQFVTALKLLATSCKFGELMNNMIKDRIVCGNSSEHVKERLLRETNLTLEKAIGISQVDEESKKQAKILKKETTTTESTMAIMKDKEEQNNWKRHRSEDTVRSQHRTPRKVAAITDKEDHSQFVEGITQKAKTDNTDENGCYVTVNVQDTPIRFKVDTGSQHHPTHQRTIKEGMPVQLEPRTRNSFPTDQEKNDISTGTSFLRCKKPVTVRCDASNIGLGAVLLQENQPIAYASHALTDTEKRYAQIEKELLAIVYALEKFNQYVYGKTVQVESDHKPL
eukprot:Em0012g91a